MTDQTQTGLGALEQTFATAKAEKRCAFMPYFTVGYPNLATSIDIIQMLAEIGADAIEVGIAFSDPLADGPVVQHSSQVSLENGTTVTDCLNAVKTLRERGVTIPLVLMSYVNPVMAYGFERYAHDAASVGAN